MYILSFFSSFWFYRYYYKSHAEDRCDDTCRKSLLCGLKSGRSHSPELCSDLGISSLQEFQYLTALKKVCWASCFELCIVFRHTCLHHVLILSQFFSQHNIKLRKLLLSLHYGFFKTLFMSSKYIFALMNQQTHQN